MKRVILESPYVAQTEEAVGENVAYAKRAALDCLRRGESPFASHLIYTRILDDRVPEERDLGIAAGFAWRETALYTVVYVDRGISGGMRLGIEDSRRRGIPVFFRELRPTPDGGYLGVDVAEPEV